jgi:hypothetical protein
MLQSRQAALMLAAVAVQRPEAFQPQAQAALPVVETEHDSVLLLQEDSCMRAAAMGSPSC